MKREKGRPLRRKQRLSEFKRGRVAERGARQMEGPPSKRVKTDKRQKL